MLLFLHAYKSSCDSLRKTRAVWLTMPWCGMGIMWSEH